MRVGANKGGWFWGRLEVHVEIRVGLMVGTNMCRLKNGQDCSCFYRGLQLETQVGLNGKERDWD